MASSLCKILISQCSYKLKLSQKLHKKNQCILLEKLFNFIKVTSLFYEISFTEEK